MRLVCGINQLVTPPEPPIPGTAALGQVYLKTSRQDLRMKKLLKSIARSILPTGVATRLRRRNARRARKDQELELLPAFSSAGCFVDIGANVGLWSATGARYFSRIVAFEPSQSLALGLQRSLPHNVEVISVALSDHDGTATFSTPILDGAIRDTRATLEATAVEDGSAVVETVKIRTLDSFELADIDLIKIDVEGHEEGVLLGAQKTIDREKPVLIIEIEERHHLGKSEEIANSLVTLGYNMFYLKDGSLKASFAREIEMLQSCSSERSRQINNFIFIHREKLDSYEGRIAESGISILR